MNHDNDASRARHTAIRSGCVSRFARRCAFASSSGLPSKRTGNSRTQRSATSSALHAAAAPGSSCTTTCRWLLITAYAYTFSANSCASEALRPSIHCLRCEKSRSSKRS
jgi:hypothetical protein